VIPLVALLALQAIRPVAVGDRLTPFAMVDAVGAIHRWQPGRVTVFSVCAYWCDTWKTQVPRLALARNTLRGLPADIQTISTDGRWAEVARNNGGLPLWRDAGAEWSRRVGIDEVPTTLVVDQAGRVVFAFGGIVRSDDVIAAVRGCVAGTVRDSGSVFLTFDDFPPRDGGLALLDALRSVEAKATLFCIASHLEADAKLVKRAAQEGHSLQCHSWQHDAVNPELGRCRAAFEHVLGQPFRLYRAPGSEKIVGLPAKLPAVDPYDYTRPGSRELLRRVLSAVRPGCEIQLHAGVSDTIEALPEIVRQLRSRGYRLETL